MYNDDEDDIPVKEPVAKKANPFDNIQLKFMQSQLAQKRNALQAAAARKNAVKPAAPPPVIDLSARNKSTGLGTSKPTTLRSIKATPVSETVSFLPKTATDDSFMMFGEYLCKSEYQPSLPNDYEKMAKAMREKKEKQKVAKEIAKRLEREHKEEDKKRSKGAAIAPPTMLMEPEPSEKPAESETKETESMPPPSFIPAFGKATSRGLGIAANIMKKHGYKEGQGLGKMEQGISTALQVEKSGARGGNIIAEAPKPTFAQNSLEAMQNATKILVLSNMISASELKNEYADNEEFRAEIREELEKCGQVVNVEIHVNEQKPDEEQVRVFVEFTNNAQSIKAFVVMNGRYFGGRNVVAGFFNIDDYKEKKFDKV